MRHDRAHTTRVADSGKRAPIGDRIGLVRADLDPGRTRSGGGRGDRALRAADGCRTLRGGHQCRPAVTLALRRLVQEPHVVAAEGYGCTGVRDRVGVLLAGVTGVAVAEAAPRRVVVPLVHRAAACVGII
ncbi:MAG: hypothetical protein ACK55I_06130, partial [bacterium]